MWGAARGELAGFDTSIICTLRAAVRHLAPVGCGSAARGELAGSDNSVVCTLRAAIRHPAPAVLGAVLPVVGNTPSIPSFLMFSYFPVTCTGFYGVKPVRYRIDSLSKVVKWPFWGGRRGAAERRNCAKLCRHVKET